MFCFISVIETHSEDDFEVFRNQLKVMLPTVQHGVVNRLRLVLGHEALDGSDSDRMNYQID